jgi:hypothetical protein
MGKITFVFGCLWVEAVPLLLLTVTDGLLTVFQLPP